MRLKTLAIVAIIVSAGCVQKQSTNTESVSMETSTETQKVDESAITPTKPETPSAEYVVNVDRLEFLIHKKINQERSIRNVSNLSHSSKLSSIARYKSWDMARNDYFSHMNSNGYSHKDMRLKFNSSCTFIGQNIYSWRKSGEIVDQKEALSNHEEIASEAVESLMNSPGHRKNILNPDFDVEGIGVFVDENGTVFVTQEFCGY